VAVARHNAARLERILHTAQQAHADVSAEALHARRCTHMGGQRWRPLARCRPHTRAGTSPTTVCVCVYVCARACVRACVRPSPLSHTCT
jgi:hypothetical protein